MTRTSTASKRLEAFRNLSGGEGTRAIRFSFLVKLFGDENLGSVRNFSGLDLGAQKRKPLRNVTIGKIMVPLR